ncbi:TPA_exp: putative PHD finger domain protein [Trichophyton benhamiae CBS 112371]|uniref:Transcription factor BYE1 n=1 Tax=Arthroderma benhamiae (strain ATCC MYA-4681 / CBS 112371) TaxID=663331 RepID=D4ALX9_ARTBC|nr:PHD finger domain protein, putative [Trichophyton benhamiae CBS 112371]EFE36388.1 PHD finger domain protein, putative [Trichophyton benhamiae CBS 112371]DAA79186.1 TPA_exp: putative PHD finger domain protein [Trichophyton benhamiae CBS 112371]
MADEPRRSGRATKGQHKNLDIDPPQNKRKSKGQGKGQKQSSNEPTPPVLNEEDEIIRCICGEYEEEEDVERDMICCDKCAAWQHNDCMGLVFPKGEEPAEYFCERCKPENHRELLDKISRGEKPWEEAAAKRAQEAEERKSRKKKGGKRGKKARQSDVKPEHSDTPIMAKGDKQSPPMQHNIEVAVPLHHEDVGAHKRKHEEREESITQESGSRQKLQKLSTNLPASSSPVQSGMQSARQSATSPMTPSQGPNLKSRSGSTAGTDHLIVARRSAATALSKLVTEIAGTAVAAGTFTIPSDSTKEAVGERLGTEIEDCMYRNLCGSAGEPNDAYKNQLRTILFNVRKNPSLRDSLLVGRTTPDAISTMSTQNMASQELREKDEEIKREAERQHTIIQEQGPRIRRTHKGEELVESDPQTIGTESVFSTAPARRDTATESELPSAKSPRHASPTAAHGQPHADRTARETSDTNRRNSSNFNIENVWSSVHSPGASHSEQQFGPGSSFNEPPHPMNKVQEDAEIDNLLRDEADSPPYSPKDIQDDGDIWHGSVSMSSVAEFRTAGRHVGGADLSAKIPWSQLVPPRITVDGRIDVQLASNYLCGLRYSHTTDISVVALEQPHAADDAVQFNRLFNYFMDRKRYGVVGKHPLPAVKDAYLVPVEAGHSKKPDFIELLENNQVQDPTPTRLLLFVLVVKTNFNQSTPSHTTPQAPSRSAASPLQVDNEYNPVDPAGLGHAQGNTLAQGPNPQQGQFNNGSTNAPSPNQALTGQQAAIHVLGPLAAAPAIQELLQRAPNASVEQLNVIAGILRQNPQAANNLQLLMGAILQTTNGTQSS